MRKIYKVILISTGPGDRDYITVLARRKVKECDVIIGTETQLASVEVNPEQVVYAESGVEDIFNLIESHMGQRTGVLVMGDAGIYSLAKKIIERYGKEAIEEIIPGVSSIQVAFARVKEPWLNVRVFSYRERPLEGLEEILKYERSAVLCDRENTSKVILSTLTTIGFFDEERRVYVCQDLTLKNERVVEIKGPSDIKKLTVGRREIILIIKATEVSLSEELQ